MDALQIILVSSAICFAAIVAGTIVAAGFQVGRYFARHSGSLDWWLIASAVGTVVSGSVVAATYFDAGSYLLSIGTAAPRMAIFIYVALVIVFAILPLAFLILRAHARHGITLFAYLYTVVAVAALPFAMLLSIVVASIGYTFLSAPDLPHMKHLELADVVKPLFEIEDQTPACTVFLVRATGLPLIDRSNATFDDRQSLEIAFLHALNTTFDALLLSIPNDAGCSLTLVRHNPDSIVATIVYLAFKTFISLVAVSVLALPFQRHLAASGAR
jgi:hypothetical protein